MLTLALTLLLALFQAPASVRNEALWEAARSGNAAAVAALLDNGVDVNARARYDMTAIGFAADKGHLEVVRLLVKRGADIDVRDTFYGFTPLALAMNNGQAGVAIFLL